MRTYALMVIPIALIALWFSVALKEAKQPPALTPGRLPATCIRVVDGDTFVAEFPGGWSENGRLLPNEKEQAAIARMRELRGEGAALRAICDKLDQAGIPSKRGSRWSVKVVWSILQQEAK